MPNHTIVLGFDLRKPISGATSDPPREDRARFLIRPEVSGPASVDPDVWPQVAAQRAQGYPFPLWGSVSEILRSCPGLGLPGPGEPSIVEIAVVVDEPSRLNWEGALLGWLRPGDDSALALASTRLGYDVADRFLLSGLNNCMLSPKELDYARQRWAPQINSVGLFEDEGEALAFSTACDSIVPEHAPFYPYRIQGVLLSGTRKKRGPSW
jgi:hypothetical protein